MTQIDLAASNISQMSVSELSTALKRTLEDRFAYVRVRGEISGFRGPHSSGHAYFSLKDDSARLDAVIWKTTYSRMKTKPVEGMEVIASGRITTFSGKSSYQIVIEMLEPAGTGALMTLLENRRKQLAAEGLFDASRKRKTPFLPRVIGVVTSPTGAVIRDILHRLADRFPIHVILWPVRVQGEGAAEELTAAVNGFNALSLTSPIARPDLIVVARGGGALEDLWGFNDESLVRSVAASGIPIISAVGHETDWTLIDLAADLRAPTPTAAAEMAVPVRADLIARVSQLEARARAAIARSRLQLSATLRATSRALPTLDDLVALKAQRLDALADRTRSLLEAKSGADTLKLARLDARLKRMSPGIGIAARREAAKVLAARLKSGALRSRADLALRIVQNGKALSAAAVRYGERNAQRSQSILRHWASARAAGARLPTALRRELEHFAQYLTRATKEDFERRRASSVKACRLFEAVNYRAVLSRGYAMALSGDNRVLTSARDVRMAQKFTLRMGDGDVAAAARSAPIRRKRASAYPDTEQKALF